MTIRRAIYFILCSLLLAAPIVSGQPSPLRICTVQPTEGFGHAGPGGPSDWGGAEANALAKELSTRKLLDGTPVQGVPIVRKTRKDAEAEAQRQGCPYIVELWWHESVDDIDTNSAPGIPSPVQRGNLMGDSDQIEYAMSGSDVRKVIARGSAPPPTVYKTGRRVTPFPLFATQITAKLNHSRPR